MSTHSPHLPSAKQHSALWPHWVLLLPGSWSVSCHRSRGHLDAHWGCCHSRKHAQHHQKVSFRQWDAYLHIDNKRPFEPHQRVPVLSRTKCNLLEFTDSASCHYVNVVISGSIFHILSLSISRAMHDPCNSVNEDSACRERTQSMSNHRSFDGGEWN